MVDGIAEKERVGEVTSWERRELVKLQMREETVGKVNSWERRDLVKLPIVRGNSW